MQDAQAAQVVPMSTEGESTVAPWWRRGFLASVFALASGTAIAQLLLLVCSPVLTRIYSPGDFAAYALYSAAVSLLAPFAAGRFEWALMLPKDEKNAASLFWLGVMLACGTSSLAAIIVGTVALGWGSWMGTAIYWAAWIPAGMLALSLWGVMVKWQARQCRFTLIARSEIGYALAAIGTQVLGGIFLANNGGAPLILGHVLGRLVAVAVLAFPLRGDYRIWRGQIAASGLRQQGLRYWRFPVFSSGASALGCGVGELPKFMLGLIAPASILGYYALAMRALRTPMFMVGQAVGGAFFPHISRLSDDRVASQRLLLRTTGVLALLSLVPAAVILSYGPSLFALVFGEEWRAAGSLARLLVPMVLAEFTFAPIHTVLQSQEKQHAFMIWQACFLAVTAAAFGAGWVLSDVDDVVLIYSVLSAGMFLGLFGMAWHYVRQIPLRSAAAPPDSALAAAPEALAA